jgi:hypothetical protein
MTHVERILMPNCLTFFVTTAGPGLSPANYGIGLYAATWLTAAYPCPGTVTYRPHRETFCTASALICSRPDDPNESVTVNKAKVLFAAAQLSIFRGHVVLAGVLNTHFLTGSVILMPAAHEIRGIPAFSTSITPWFH